MHATAKPGMHTGDGRL